MKYLQLTVLLLGLSLGLSSCRLFGGCEDDKLEMSQTAYEGDNLRTDGYYFGEMDGYRAKEVFYFYRNGIVYAPGGVDLEEAVSGISPEKWPNLNVAMSDLGLYMIEGDRIIIERWRPSQCGAKIIYEVGEILSDTSFIIATRESRDNGKVRDVYEINSTFYFRQGEKPDSTNNYIN